MIPSFHDVLLDFDRDAETEVAAQVHIAPGGLTRNTMVTAPAKMRLQIGPLRRAGELPLVSCLMPTKGRFEQVQLSIGCYRRQTWPKRELIVLDQNEDDRLARWIAGLDDPTIRYFSMPGLDEPLGTIRNRTMDLASGKIIGVWDDDDLHHPARIEICVGAMAVTKSIACVLGQETMWMPNQQRIGLRKRQPYCNTLFTLREVGLRYPPLRRQSDAPAVYALLAERRSVILELPELYIYIAHGRNLWDDANMERNWSLATDRNEGPATEAVLGRLSRIFPIIEYRAALAGRDAAEARTRAMAK